MGADQSWQFVFLEAVIERPPTRDTGHPGRPITLTVDLLRDEEGDDAAQDPGRGSFAVRKGAAGHGHGHGGGAAAGGGRGAEPQPQQPPSNSNT